jgi:arylsulfatase A-like enzyme
MPTFIELAGGVVPSGLDAESLVPLLQERASRESALYGEFYGHQLPGSQRCIRTDALKYVFNGGEIDELYDLRDDPHERSRLKG